MKKTMGMILVLILFSTNFLFAQFSSNTSTDYLGNTTTRFSDGTRAESSTDYLGNTRTEYSGFKKTKKGLILGGTNIY